MGWSATTVMAILGFALVAAGFDIWRYRVPNWLTVAMMVSGLVASSISQGWVGGLASLGAILLALVLLGPFWVMGGIGAGDVKLLMGVAAWVGPTATLYIFGVTGILVGLVSLAMMAWYGGFRRSWLTVKLLVLGLGTVGKHLGAGERVEEVMNAPDRRRRLIPFGAVLVAALVTILLWQATRGGGF